MREIEEEIEHESRDPKFQAYEDKWLKRFTEIYGPVRIIEPTPYGIFRQLFSDDIVHMLVTETNRYYEQYIAKLGGVDNLPPSSTFRR